jgi:short-subunit dehydrogenase
LDLANSGAVEQLGHRLQEFAPDLFIHAAAIAPKRADADAIGRTVAVNFTSAVHLCDAITPGMVERGRGNIVLISSLAALEPIDGFAVYGASKAALDAYAASLRAELTSAGINVLLARPGRMATDFFARNGFPDDVVAQARRFPRPRDAAEAILDHVGSSGEYVHGTDRWLLRARRLLPRRLTHTLWEFLT